MQQTSRGLPCPCSSNENSLTPKHAAHPSTPSKLHLQCPIAWNNHQVIACVTSVVGCLSKCCSSSVINPAIDWIRQTTTVHICQQYYNSMLLDTFTGGYFLGTISIHIEWYHALWNEKISFLPYERVHTNTTLTQLSCFQDVAHLVCVVMSISEYIKQHRFMWYCYIDSW